MQEKMALEFSEYVEEIRKDSSNITHLIMIEIAAAIASVYLVPVNEPIDILLLLGKFIAITIGFLIGWLALMVFFCSIFKDSKRLTPLRFNQILLLLPIVSLLIYSVYRMMSNG